MRETNKMKKKTNFIKKIFMMKTKSSFIEKKNSSMHAYQMNFLIRYALLSKPEVNLRAVLKPISLFAQLNKRLVSRSIDG